VTGVQTCALPIYPTNVRENESFEKKLLATCLSLLIIKMFDKKIKNFLFKQVHYFQSYIINKKEEQAWFDKLSQNPNNNIQEFINSKFLQKNPFKIIDLIYQLTKKKISNNNYKSQLRGYTVYDEQHLNIFFDGKKINEDIRIFSPEAIHFIQNYIIKNWKKIFSLEDCNRFIENFYAPTGYCSLQRLQYHVQAYNYNKSFPSSDKAYFILINIVKDYLISAEKQTITQIILEIKSSSGFFHRVNFFEYIFLLLLTNNI
jgi:hypothetical protein